VSSGSEVCVRLFGIVNTSLNGRWLRKRRTGAFIDFGRRFDEFVGAIFGAPVGVIAGFIFWVWSR